MLSRDDLLAMYERCGLSDQARAVIDHIRCSDPGRRVRSGRGNVSGRYPSKKMGVTIEFESHRVELAAIYKMEHDAAVLELCAGRIYVGQAPGAVLLTACTARRAAHKLMTIPFESPPKTKMEVRIVRPGVFQSVCSAPKSAGTVLV